ncbi:hypothetical protein IAR55_005896 [Kwoniella newhampshirensis]|uniref:Metallo-beta-lactamase domain-containing protein n=1 Tax=Kwoniella newhampshirensis TaxID=1651941 RepID=A0AAW0YVR1_9TREE
MSAKVSVIPETVERVKGDHWKNANGTAFVNPWLSFKPISAKDLASGMRKDDPILKKAKQVIPHVIPTFGQDLSPAQIRSTWLGHACVLIEMPTIGEKSSRGVRVLFDPVLGEGMAFLGLGPKRESTSPCNIKDIPQIDAIAISHNHYDHLDLPTLTELFAVQKSQYGAEPLLFLPLNNWRTVSGLGVARERVIEMDWWEERTIVVEGVGSTKIICTPAQHASARTPFDKDKSLWSSWALKDEAGASVWFGGDTGYCTMHIDSHSLDDLPKGGVCPAFKEIGERLGPFTLGLIPIGAYDPRIAMSPLHAAPIDSVRMYTDTKCQNAVAIHWGTFRMTPEDFDEPPRFLEDAKKKVGLQDESFQVCAIGESRGFSV